MKRIAVTLALCSFLSLSFAEEHSDNDAVDYGDYSSMTLQVKSWDALGEGKYEHVLKYTEKCAELYEEKAKEMQASLDKKPSAKDVNDYWALNDVGTCYFIRGEALTKMKREKEALAAYMVLAEDLYYAQAWDPKGWYWSPVDAAYPKIEMLHARIDKDF